MKRPFERTATHELLRSFLWCCFIQLHKVILIFDSADEILESGVSNESYRAVLSCKVVYYAVQDGTNY